MLKNKYSLLPAFIIVFFISFTNYVSALEVDYGSKLGSNPTFAAYLTFIFTWLLSIAGVLALISFVMGAVQMIASAESPDAASNGKDRMKGAVLGLVLTLASYVILNTINPVLVGPSVTQPSNLGGVVLVNSSCSTSGSASRSAGDSADCSKQIAAPQSDDFSALPSGYTTIENTCAHPATDPAALVWIFQNAGAGGDGNFDGVTVQRMACGGTINLTSGSFKWAFEAPGIYYCLGTATCGSGETSGTVCDGYMSDVNTNDEDIIADPFGGKIQSVRIVNSIDNSTPSNTANNIYYGVIFHKETDLTSGGECNVPIMNTSTDIQCPAVSNSADTFAANIFAINNPPTTSGDGISFYSEPYGWDTGANAGFYDVPTPNGTPFSFPPNLSNQPNYFDASSMKFDYTNVDRPDTYQNDDCPGFKDCPGSIRIKGTYLVALYSGKTGTPSYCQTFESDVANLKAQPIIASGGAGLNYVNIIPTK